MNIQTSQAIFLIGLAWYLATRAVYQRRAVGNETTVKRSSIVDRLLVVLVVFGQIIIPLIYVLSPLLNFANYEQMPSLIPLGTFAWAAGMWVFWRSHADLGKNWSVSLELHSGHRLVTHGIYRTLRHPMYASFLLFGAGQALLLPNWLAGLSALVAVVLMCIVRVPHEEAMMCEHFGQEYQEYMKRSGGVIPRLAGRHAA